MLLSSVAHAQSGAGLIKSYIAPRQLKNVDHAIVYRRENEFCAWPHISGFWNMRDGELLQNFGSITTDYANAEVIGHDQVDAHGHRKMVTVRSKDYGRTWDGASPAVDIFDTLAKGTENAKTLSDLGPIDYADRNVLIANSSTDFSTGKARSYVHISRDRGHSWSARIPLALDGLQSLSAIHSTLVRPDGAVLLWMYEADKNGFNRHPLVYELPPRGTEFHFLSFVTPKQDPLGTVDGEYPGWLFGGNRWYYPRGYLLPSGRMLTVLRTQRDPRGVMWTEIYASDDGGDTWGFRSRVTDYGAPGSLVVLPDGRLVMVYGYRPMPSGIRAKVSEDEGKSWGPELIIRDDGGSWDLGYPNAWVTDDGKVGVIYYFNSRNDRIKVNGGVRHIERSIFSVDES
jgi:hypothetical protein